jgi:hypothetical protein
MPSLDYFAFAHPFAEDGSEIEELSNAVRTSSYMVNGLRPPTFVNTQVCGCEQLPELLESLGNGSGAPGGAIYDYIYVELESLTDAYDLYPEAFHPLDASSDLTFPNVNIVFDQVPNDLAEGIIEPYPVAPPAEGYVLDGLRLQLLGMDFGSYAGATINLMMSDGAGSGVPGFSTVTGAGIAAWDTDPSVALLGVAGVNPGVNTVTAVLKIADPSAGAQAFALVALIDGTLPDSISIGAAQWVWKKLISSGYSTPAADNAPWYDPLIPESALFAGLLVTGVEGLDSSPVRRTTFALNRGGSVLGPLVSTERNIVFQGELHGASCCAVAYGLRWLTQTLRRVCSPVDCAEMDFFFLNSCPQIVEACGDIGTIDETTNSPWRMVTNVGLFEPPVVTERRGIGCGSCGCSPSISVEFSLVAGNPAVYVEPAIDIFALDNIFEGNDYNVAVDCDNINWRCGPPTICVPDQVVYDPACGAIPPPPVPQQTIGCLCEPLAAYSMTVPIEIVVPENYTASISVQIVNNSATDPVRNVIFRVYERDGATCEEDGEYPTCDLLAGSAISFIPTLSTFLVDSPHKSSIITIPGGRQFTGGRSVFAPTGVISEWIELPCNGNFCLSVEVDAFNWVDGTQLAVSARLQEG